MHRDIEDVIIRFATLSDDGDVDGLGRLLTDDVVYEGPARTFGPGQADLLEFVRNTTAERASRSETGRHLVTNVRTEVDEDGIATAQSYVTFLLTTREGTKVGGFARYEDRLVRVGDDWKIAARRVLIEAVD